MNRVLPWLLLPLTLIAAATFRQIFATQRELSEQLVRLRESAAALPTKADLDATLATVQKRITTDRTPTEGAPPRMTGTLSWGDPPTPMGRVGVTLLKEGKDTEEGRGISTTSEGLFGFDQVDTGWHYLNLSGAVTPEGRWFQSWGDEYCRIQVRGPRINVRPGMQIIKVDWNVKIPIRRVTTTLSRQTRELITACPKRFSWELHFQHHEPQTPGRLSDFVQSRSRELLQGDAPIAIAPELPEVTIFGCFRTANESVAPGVFFRTRLPTSKIPDSIVIDVETTDRLSPKDYWKQVEESPSRRHKELTLKITDKATGTPIP
jgi:hypothetical protein